MLDQYIMQCILFGYMFRIFILSIKYQRLAFALPKLTLLLFIVLYTHSDGITYTKNDTLITLYTISSLISKCLVDCQSSRRRWDCVHSAYKLLAYTIMHTRVCR